MFLVAEFEKVEKKCRSNLLGKLYEKNWEKLLTQKIVISKIKCSKIFFNLCIFLWLKRWWNQILIILLALEVITKMTSK
jgi:hypothetical protein